MNAKRRTIDRPDREKTNAHRRKKKLSLAHLSRDLIEMDTESAMNRILEAFSERLRSEEHRHEVENYVTSLKRKMNVEMNQPASTA